MMDHETSANWQQRVFMAVSSYDSSSWNYHYDNASNHCHVDELPCPDQSVLMIILRWVKIFVLKVGRMYYAAPLCLMMLPLIVGLSIGFAMGSSVKRRRLSLQTFCSNLWIYSIGNYYLYNNSNKKQSKSSVSAEKEDMLRKKLKSDAETYRESGVPLDKVPQHIAVIMDGNRRYGKQFHPENPTQGHWEGSKTLVEFCKWCIAEGISTLTVYAFSTENWNRAPDEVAALMAIFVQYCDELRVEAIQRNIRIRVLSTETERIPAQVKAGMKRMVDETAHCTGGLLLQICLSYGSRSEIVQACRQVAIDVQQNALSLNDINEDTVQERLMTVTDPDVVIRTSGEYRISNFLLWQLAYAELFFLPKTWPEMKKHDLLEVIRDFAHGRDRRFGK